MAAENQDTGFRISRRKLLLGGAIGAFVATNVGALAVRMGFFKSDKDLWTMKDTEEKTEPLELSFAGPFGPYQNIDLEEVKYENPWVTVQRISFTEEFNRLNVFWGFNGKVTPARRMRVIVSVTAVDGKSYTLQDAIRSDGRLEPVRSGGTTGVYTEAVTAEGLDLPRKPSEITNLRLCFLPTNSAEVK